MMNSIKLQNKIDSMNYKIVGYSSCRTTAIVLIDSTLQIK